MIYYFSFVPVSISDRLSVWLGVEVVCLLFFSAFYIGFGLETKKAILGVFVWLIWGLGFLIIPFPEGYGEEVLGGWAALLGVIIVLYVRYKRSRNNGH